MASEARSEAERRKKLKDLAESMLCENVTEELVREVWASASGDVKKKIADFLIRAVASKDFRPVVDATFAKIVSEEVEVLIEQRHLEFGDAIKAYIDERWEERVKRAGEAALSEMLGRIKRAGTEAMARADAVLRNTVRQLPAHEDGESWACHKCRALNAPVLDRCSRCAALRVGY